MRTRMRREDRRRQLLDVTAALVVERGVGAVTFDAVATAAGVAAGLPYAYFDSVDAMLVELFDEVIGGIDASIEGFVAGHEPFEVLVRASLETWLVALGDRRRLVLALLDGRANPAVATRLQARDDTARATWRSVATTDLGLDGSRADVLATVLTDSAPGVLLLAVRRRGAAREQVVAAFVDLAVGAAAGLGAPVSGGGRAGSR